MRRGRTVASAPNLEVRRLSKQFGGARALSDVDLDVVRGEIHGLCGANGSGKSTLIKVLSGVHQAEPGGMITCAGVTHEADRMTPALAQQLGVCVVHQDLGIFPDMTVAENMSLGRGFDVGAGRRIRWREVRRRTQRLIDRFEIPARPDTQMLALSKATQTQVAIARALQDRDEEASGVLILDEPTAALSLHEVEVLLAALKAYADRGQSILYVSHRLDEVLDLTDRVTVLQDGMMVGSWDTAALDESKLIAKIVGRALDKAHHARSFAASTAPAVEVRDLWAGPLRGFDIRVGRGEVVGIAGLLGSGRSELLGALFGVVKPDRGEIRIDDKPVRLRRPKDAMQHGVALVPEDRSAEGGFLDMPVYMNLSVAVLGSYFRGLRLRQREMQLDSARQMETYGIKAPSARASLNTLSGGNQQKVILARWMRRAPTVLLLDEPTVGVDVGARAEIYKLVHRAAEDGAAVIVVASDFEELAEVVDRAIVLRGGRAVAEVSGAALTAHGLAEATYTDGNRESAVVE